MNSTCRSTSMGTRAAALPAGVHARPPAALVLQPEGARAVRGPAPWWRHLRIACTMAMLAMLTGG